MSTNSLLHQAHQSFQELANVQRVRSPFLGLLDQTLEVLVPTKFHTNQAVEIAHL